LSRAARVDPAAAGLERHAVPLAELTTLRLGGPARRLRNAALEPDVIETVRAADAAREPLLVIAGGSNLVIADGGFDGTVLGVRTRGVATDGHGDRLRLTAAAGEPWDALVARCTTEGLAGIECLSGIPGSTGATPIQNVGAYGEQVSDTIVRVRAYDRAAGEVIKLTAAQCEFAYRSSRFRHTSQYVVLEVTLELERSRLSAPIAYPELARTLGIAPGVRAPLAAVREAVLELRRRKGMVLDRADADSVSAGSFFLNPILSAEAFVALERRAAERLEGQAPPPAWSEPDGGVKTSAAWLIERAGFYRGYGTGRAGISSKHTLALVNRGGASAAELIALAREIRDGVQERFGVTLRPEPTLVGIEL
jgi:UDP-N-acetylmuramate dehydrogenase